MGPEHLYGRIITAALGIPSCGCASGSGSGDECRVLGEAAHSATQRPWASALDFACLTAKGARSANAALTAITQKLFSGMGFRYDTIWGSPSYCGHWSKGFHLTNYLRRKRVKVNCYDQAYAVSCSVVSYNGAAIFFAITLCLMAQNESRSRFTMKAKWKKQ